MSKMNLVCTGINKHEERHVWAKIHELGGNVRMTNGKENFPDNIDAVIVDRLSGTDKLVTGLAAGLPLLHVSYIDTCHAVNDWVPIKDFDLGEPRYESLRLSNKIHIPELKNRKSLKENGGIFKDWKVVLLIENSFSRCKYARTIQMGGGECIKWTARHLADLSETDIAKITHIITEPLILKQSDFLRFIEKKSDSTPLPPVIGYSYITNCVTKERPFSIDVFSIFNESIIRHLTAELSPQVRDDLVEQGKTLSAKMTKSTSDTTTPSSTTTSIPLRSEMTSLDKRIMDWRGQAKRKRPVLPESQEDSTKDQFFQQYTASFDDDDMVILDNSPQKGNIPNRLSQSSDTRRFSSESSFDGSSIVSQRASFSMDENRPVEDPNRHRRSPDYQQPQQQQQLDPRRSAPNSSRSMEFPRWENPRMRNPSSEYDRCISPWEDPHAPSQSHDARSTSFDGGRTIHGSHSQRLTEIRLEDTRIKHPSYENLRRSDDQPPKDPRLEDPRRNITEHREPGADNFHRRQLHRELELNKTVEIAQDDDDCLIIEPDPAEANTTNPRPRRKRKKLTREEELSRSWFRTPPEKLPPVYLKEPYEAVLDICFDRSDKVFCNRNLVEKYHKDEMVNMYKNRHKTSSPQAPNSAA